MRFCNNAIWNLSARCNFSCPYCFNEIQKKRYGKLPFPDSRTWASAWNRLERELIVDITGGEPFLWPGLVDFICNLSEDIRVAISTNASLDIIDFVQKISPQRCINITISYHPSNKGDLNSLIGKVLLLKNRGFNTNINFVAYPEQMWIIPSLINIFAQFDISIHIDPYLQNSETPYFSYNEQELDFLNYYISDNRKVVLKRGKTPQLCDAGSNYFIVMPDASVYRCITQMSYEPPIGNFLDEKFELLPEPKPCHMACSIACDVDHSCRQPLKEVLNTDDTA